MCRTIVVVPSRQRYSNHDRLVKSFKDTNSGTAALEFVLDEDDADNYTKANGVIYRVLPRAGFISKMNTSALANLEYKYIVQVGDDVVFRTPGWDVLMADAVEAMGGVGLAYANDLHNHGASMPTQPCISTNMVEALGYIVWPELTHCFFDVFWRDLCFPIGLAKWLPEVILEHMHPDAGKAERDIIYSSNDSQIPKDTAVLHNWRLARMEQDRKMIKELVDAIRQR